MTDRPFRVHAELFAWKSADEHPMRIGGIVSTDQLDRQGEEIVQTGLDFSPFLREGWFNDNHGQRTSDVLGYPTDARYVRKGSQLPNGRIAESNGWWAEGYLLDTPEGRRIHELCQSLEKAPGNRRLGYSIEGKVGERDPAKPSRILTALVKNVAITHCPVNPGTEMHALVKALSAGSAISNPGAAPGEGFPLRAESMDKANDDDRPFGREGSADNAWTPGAEEEQDPHQTTNLAGQMGDDPNNGGWAGQNPHTTPPRSPREGLPPRQKAIIKADVERDFPLEPMSEVDALDRWTDALAAAHKRIQPEDRMTKAEARIIVRSERPGISEAEVDEIVNRAAIGEW